MASVEADGGWTGVERRHSTSVALRRALQTERTMAKIRWGAVAFSAVQVNTYYIPYPSRSVLLVALLLVALLAVGNALISLRLHWGIESLRMARRLGLAALTLDIVVAMGFVFVYTFDPDTAIFALLYLLPLEAALRFHLRGALVTMAVVTVLYVIREAYGFYVHEVPFLMASVNFRMGIGWLIAAVAGTMASNLVRDRRELEVAKEKLERSAAMLAASNAGLEAANEIKDDFLAMTNHELRTPLTTVLGYTSMLRKRWEAIPDERRQEFVLRIEEQGLRLHSMVESLLTLSSAQAGALQLSTEVLPVRAAVDDAIRQHGLAGAGFTNDCPDGLTVHADRVRLAQILVNYLTNARKYGQPPITVTATSEGDYVLIAVEDEGDGVPPHFVPRLFDKFSQASIGDSRTAEGAGLGLAIVRQLAQAQGGDAWYELRQPKGARFLVKLRGGHLAD